MALNGLLVQFPVADLRRLGQEPYKRTGLFHIRKAGHRAVRQVKYRGPATVVFATIVIEPVMPFRRIEFDR